MKVSIIIPTVKNEPVTVKSLKHCPVSYQLILSRKFGLGYARNYGARQAKHDLLVFLDDDLILNQEIWETILTTCKGEFRMTKAKFSDLPCTRVMTIHAEDFWRIGGFDESIKFTGEDRVFYIEAIQRELNFSEIPMKFVVHVHHERRSYNKRVAINMILESCRSFAKYGFKYARLTHYFIYSSIKEMRLRSFVIRLLAFTYYALKVMLTGR